MKTAKNKQSKYQKARKNYEEQSSISNHPLGTVDVTRGDISHGFGQPI